MKKLCLIIVAIVSITAGANAGPLFRVPKFIKAYVKEHYPNARKIQCYKSGSIYETYFIANSKEVYIDLTADGTEVYKTKEIDYRELPSYISGQFSEKSVDFAGVGTGSYGDYYIVEIRKRNSFIEYTYKMEEK